MFIQILFVFLLVFALTFIYKSNKIEKYDARISGITKEKCGTVCTEVFGCVGFGYDKKNSKCYLSERPILNQPGNSIYSDLYEFDHYRCNKIDPLRPDIDNEDTITNDRLRKNMIYSCANEERDFYNTYKIVNNSIVEAKKTNTSGDTRPSSYLNVELEKYPLNEIKWPNVRKDIELKDITSHDEEKVKNYILFEKDNKEYLGQYLYPYKCVNDVSEKACLDECKNNAECIGVEWNQSYKNSKNVCCPKKQIREIITRRKEFENGNFYNKKIVNELPKDNSYVKIIRTPFY